MFLVYIHPQPCQERKYFNYHHLCSSPFLLVHLHNCHCDKEVFLHNQCDDHNLPPHQHNANPGCTSTNLQCQNSSGIDCFQHCILHLCSQSDHYIALYSTPSQAVQWHSYQFRRQEIHHIRNLSDIHPLPLGRLCPYKRYHQCYQFLADSSFFSHHKPVQSSNQCQLSS